MKIIGIILIVLLVILICEIIVLKEEIIRMECHIIKAIRNYRR